MVTVVDFNVQLSAEVLCAVHLDTRFRFGLSSVWQVHSAYRSRHGQIRSTSAYRLDRIPSKLDIGNRSKLESAMS